VYKKVFPYILLALFVNIGFDSIIKISEQSDLKNVTAFFEHFTTFMIGSLFVIIGLSCYIQKRYSQVANAFFYLMYVTGIAISFSKPSSMGLSPSREIEVLSVSFAPYFLMLFFSHFPVSAKPKFFHKIKSATFCLALGIDIIYISMITGSFQEHSAFSYIIRLGVIFNMVLALIASVGLIVLHLKSNSLWVKNQLYILIFSIVISFAPVFLLSLIPEGIFHYPSIPFYYSLNSIMVFPVTLAYLLMKQEIIDISTSVNKYFYAVLSMGITLIFINVLFSFIIELSFQQLILINLCVLVSLLTFNLFQKLFEPFKQKRWKVKTEEIQREKKLIFQQLLDGKHLTACAEHIIGLIQKVIDINDACIIWKKVMPIVLYKSGIFNNRETCDFIIETITIQNSETRQIIKEGLYSIFPLQNEEKTIGWMVIGQKKNLTILDKKEWILLKKIQEDAVELLSNAETLYRFEKKLRKTQQKSDMFNHYNTVLLHDLEEEQRKLSVFLHDEVLQGLIFVKNKLQVASKGNPDIESCIKNIIYDVREMCNDLHPVMAEELGLEPSLQALKKKLQMNHNVLIDLDCQLQLIIIPTALSVNIFRMIKELVHNAIKHASPSKIKVSLAESEEVITIKVEDDGKGLDMPNLESIFEQNSIGLATVQKRVDLLSGVLDIRSEQNIGTFITITLPVEGSEMIENKGVIS
jgi:two-component system, NarL family, sensor histidine kinase ComP